MLINKYVLLVEEDNKILGRLVDERGGINGFVVFPHKDLKNPRPGLLKITDLQIKYNKNNTQYGFVNGEYVVTREINYSSLNIKEKHSLVAIGYAKSISEINGHEYILVKNEVNCSKIYYVAFLTKDGFVYVNNLKYISEGSIYKRSLKDLDKSMMKDMLTTPMRCIQEKGKFTPHTEGGELRGVKCINPTYIRKNILNIDGIEDINILLYLCNPSKVIDIDVYRAIVEYNKDVKKQVQHLRDIEFKDESRQADIDKMFNILEFYNI